MSLLPLWAIDLNVDEDVGVSMGGKATTTLNGNVRSSREVDEDEDQDDDEDEHEEESALSSYSSQILILLTTPTVPWL
ncbi:hypothetical protein M5D96_004416 [Drosophila gunungcola]|uniref:Uncharacterized protein n=1 Tax=Drosophila gunungcola TaxID=103775 RepID=A0A9P9YTY9_9MUSC|nr:hypothetical protein M5D96_004416 [Drosophila gunungcola]